MTSCSEREYMVYLGLGSNLGDRATTLDSAVRSIGRLLRWVVVSSLYETAPMYVADQPAFLNAVVGGLTSWAPGELLAHTREIERLHGRDHARSGDKGPRSLDIDILLVDQLVLSTPDLVIPHPALCERRFVLEPLLELAPDLIHPSNGLPLRVNLDALPDQGVYCYRHNPYNERAPKEHHS